MKMIIIGAVLGLISFVTIPARADDGPIDGTLLKTVCAAPLDSVPGRFCVGYVAGYLDGMMNGVAATTAGAHFCFPKGLTVSETVTLVQKYLGDGSNDLTKPGGFVVGRALYGLYGCKPSN